MIINGFHKVLNQYNKTHKHLSLRAVARITGTTTYSITALYNGKAKGIKFDVLNKLIKFFNVPLTNLINYKIGDLNFYLINNDDPKVISKYRKSKAFKKLSSKQKENSSRVAKRTITMYSKDLGALSFTVKSVHYHKYDVDIGNMFAGIDSLLLKPLRKADVTNFTDNKVPHQIHVYIKTILDTNDNKRRFFKDIFDNLPNEFKEYIWTRALLHSGILNIHAKPYGYYFTNDNYVHAVNVDGYLPLAKPSKLIQWQKIQHKDNKFYHLQAKSGNYKINLYDHTTNNFAK